MSLGAAEGGAPIFPSVSILPDAPPIKELTVCGLLLLPPPPPLMLPRVLMLLFVGGKTPRALRSSEDCFAPKVGFEEGISLLKLPNMVELLPPNWDMLPPMNDEKSKDDCFVPS
jgi:hypothetical protein